MIDFTKHDPEIPITLRINWGSVGNIIGGLSELPAKYSRDLMDEIERQAVSQLPSNTNNQVVTQPQFRPMQ